MWSPTYNLCEVSDWGHRPITCVRSVIGVIDCVVRCRSSLHPSLPLLATASGQRSFTLSMARGDSDDSDDSDDEVKTEEVTVDNSLRLWWLGVDESTTEDASGDTS